MASVVTKALPQKKYFRQRAHSNPISDHQFDYPVRPEDVNWSTCYPTSKFVDPSVRFLDIGCGYGGLLVALSPLFPEKLMLGMEIRVKVQQYVEHRIQALREQNVGESYSNIAVIRTNAMKYLPNFFQRGQIEKMFFLYPDPHFKKSKYKWRIINETLLAEYAYVLAENARVYTVTDVEELHIWMAKHFDEHPLFEAVPETELADDPVATLVMDSTEEGKKVSRNKGSKFIKVFRRIKPEL